MQKNELIRLSKRMSELGMCSRREADTLIEQGLVLVNGQVVSQLGSKVHPTDKVELLKKGQSQLDQKVTLIIHKPVGYVSAQAEKDYKPAIKLVTKSNQMEDDVKANIHKWNLKSFAPAGRLDIDSKGLLILTQDGKVAKKIISPDSKIEKEYIVKVKGNVTESCIKKLCYGLTLDGKKLKRAKVSVLRENLLKFILIEGKKRQIRRMCDAVDLKVISLKRVRIGNLRLGNLKEGQWRQLRKDETI